MKNSFRLLPYLLVVFTLVIVFPLLGGCSVPGETDRLSELLKLVPASVDAPENFVIINDYASSFEDVGISLAELDEQSVSFQEFTDLIRDEEIDMAQMSLAYGSYITGWGEYASQEIIRDKNVGYSFTSIDAEIQAGLPPADVVAAIGRYDPEATRKALENQDDWPSWAVEAYTTEEYRGITIHSWGDGLEIHIKDSRLTPPHIDNLGRAKPLAFTDDYLFCSASLENVKAMIDASQDKAQSLADLPQYAEIVGKMSELGVYSVVMGNELMAKGQPGFPQDYTGPRLKKFLTFGSASGKDENGNYMVLVLYHENPENAEANVSLLEERINTTDMIDLEMPWTEVFTTTDIRAEGNLLVAKLYTERSDLWAFWVYGYELILPQEEM